MVGRAREPPRGRRIRVAHGQGGGDVLGQLGRRERLAAAQQHLCARQPDARILLGGVPEGDEPVLDRLQLSRRDQLGRRSGEEPGRELEAAGGDRELDRVCDAAARPRVRDRLVVQRRPACGIARLERAKQEAPDERVEAEEPVARRDEQARLLERCELLVRGDAHRDGRLEHQRLELRRLGAEHLVRDVAGQRVGHAVRRDPLRRGAGGERDDGRPAFRAVDEIAQPWRAVADERCGLRRSQRKLFPPELDHLSVEHAARSRPPRPAPGRDEQTNGRDGEDALDGGVDRVVQHVVVLDREPCVAVPADVGEGLGGMRGRVPDDAPALEPLACQDRFAVPRGRAEDDGLRVGPVEHVRQPGPDQPPQAVYLLVCRPLRLYCHLPVTLPPRGTLY